jgi:hypothetical protein
MKLKLVAEFEDGRKFEAYLSEREISEMESGKCLFWNFAWRALTESHGRESSPIAQIIEKRTKNE